MKNTCIISNEKFNNSELYLIEYKDNNTKLICHKKYKKLIIHLITFFLKNQNFDFDNTLLNFKIINEEYTDKFNVENYKKFLNLFDISTFNNILKQNYINEKDNLILKRISHKICDWF